MSRVSTSSGEAESASASETLLCESLLTVSFWEGGVLVEALSLSLEPGEGGGGGLLRVILLGVEVAGMMGVEGELFFFVGRC